LIVIKGVNNNNNTAICKSTVDVTCQWTLQGRLTEKNWNVLRNSSTD